MEKILFDISKEKTIELMIFIRIKEDRAGRLSLTASGVLQTVVQVTI